MINGIGSSGVSFVIMLLLARILTPNDFGLIAIISIFIQVSQAFITSGFPQALIQKKEVDHLDYSSVFYTNVGLGLLFYVINFIIAEPIALFYNKIELENIIKTLSLLFVINSFALVQDAIMNRKLDYKRLALINVPSVLVAGMIAIYMASNEYGVWSIVAFQLINRLLYTIQIWFFSAWKPSFVYSIERIKGLFGFSGYLLLSGIITMVYNNMYQLFFGKQFSIVETGYYQNSLNLTLTPAQVISSSINQVAFSSLSRVQEENKIIADTYSKIGSQMSFILAPILTFSSIIANDLFLFIFSAKWMPSVPYFQLLCCLGFLIPIANLNFSILNVKGKSNYYLVLTIFRILLASLGILLTYKYGILFIIVSQILTMCIIIILLSEISHRLINLSKLEQFKNLFLPLFFSTIAGGFIILNGVYIRQNSLLINIILSYSLGFIVYFLICYKFRKVLLIDFKNLILK